MTLPPDRHSEDLPPDLPAAEAELLAATAKALEDARPLPRPEFRGQLRRELTEGRRRRAWERQARWQPLAASYAAIGAALLAVAAIGLTGAGPFGV